MSWDYDEYLKACPCGKGQIRVVHGSNDWGQTSHDETILCPECKAKDAAKKREKQARNQRYRELASFAVTYFREHYLEQWRSLFRNDKFKKDFWATAINANVETRSLNSFYNHNSSMDTYIDSFVTLVNIPKIALKLGIEDLELQQLLEEPLRLHKEIESESLAAAYLYYKGR
jgi:hypothetical protein